MASLLMSLCSTTLLLLLITGSAPVSVTSEEFKVGGNEGWRLPTPTETDMYTRWAQTMKFHVGDSLRFVYKNESVMVVEKYGYYHCNSTHPTFVYKDGNSVINLERPGPRYFVSGDPDHCKKGQRLMVEVIDLHPMSPPSPPQPVDAAPAPSPSAAECLSFVPQLLMFYLLVIAASIGI